MSFEEAYEEFKIYAQKRHKKQGFITITTRFNNHVLPYFTGRSINELSTQDIMFWQDKILDSNFSNKYNFAIYSAFKTFIDYCVNCSYLQENIVSQVGSFKKKIENKHHTIYNLQQFRKFRKYISNFVIKQFFNFMYFYGTRPSEAMALRFLDLKKCYIYVRHSIHRKGDRDLDTPKNQSSIRILKISLLMRFRLWLLKRYYLKQYGAFSNDYFIFGGRKPLAPTTIDRHKKIAYEKAKLPSITQHEFRHSYATRKIHKKTPIDIVSRTLGHSKVSTTLDIYLHQEKNTYNVSFQ